MTESSKLAMKKTLEVIGSLDGYLGFTLSLIEPAPLTLIVSWKPPQAYSGLEAQYHEESCTTDGFYSISIKINDDDCLYLDDDRASISLDALQYQLMAILSDTR